MPKLAFLVGLLCILSGFVNTIGADADPLSLGKFAIIQTGSPDVIAAPHGGFDLGTESIAERIAKNIGWNCIVATGFRKRVHPYNVNRPTEGIGLVPALEKYTKAAKAIFEVYENKVFALAGHNPGFYVEIHGEGSLSSENRIEIATVGITKAQAKKIKGAFHAELKALGLDREYEVVVEPLDSIYFQATAAKKSGVLSKVDRALHIELPRQLRMEEARTSVRLLSVVLPQVEKLVVR